MPAPSLDVHDVARLARIGLAPDEEARFGSQLGQILAYVEQLKALDVTGVEPMSHAAALVNVTRPDVVRPSLSQEEVLRSAPAQANGLFVVPKIVE